MKRFVTTGLVAAVIAGGFAASAQAEDNFITIGTGGVTGVYYPTGGAICRLVNRGKKEHGIRCTVESTGGSVYNVNAIREKELQFGVVQSDWQYNGYKGEVHDTFKKNGPFEGLRAVFSIHPEPFTTVARADSGIAKFEDLAGKRVNIGNPGSGARGTMEVVMGAMGWNKETFSFASELATNEQSQALCDNKVDAIVFTVGHPSGTIQEATTSCDSRLVATWNDEIEALVKKYPYYAKATIPGGMYTGNPDPITTFGVKATFVSSTDVSADTVYEVVKAVYENFDRFKKLHPAFENLDAKEMITGGNSAPLHDGAARYYKEKGMM